MDAENDAQPSTRSCTMQETARKRPLDLEKGPSGKKDSLSKAKRKNRHPMAAKNDPQYSTSNGTTHQNGHEKPAKKANWEKGHPKIANDDPQFSTSNDTIQKNYFEKMEIKTKWIRSHPYPQPSTDCGTTQQNGKKAITEKAIIDLAIIENAIAEYEKSITGVRSCVNSPFSRCTPILDWIE